jgi:thioredoxin reductase
LSHDLAVVGAGPAGMAAAIAAAESGLSVIVLDEQTAAGGQVHRALESRRHHGGDDRDGAALIAAFRGSRAEHRNRSAVWQAERRPDGFRLHVSRDGRLQRVAARALVIATGALERPVPIPGWTLPGVMTVGAAQILLKTGGNVPASRVVIAGQGPLPLLYATQLIGAGVRPAAILDTTPRGALRRVLPHAIGALRNAGQLIRGLGFIATIRRAGVPMVRATDVQALGDGRLARVRYRTQGATREIDAELLLLHEGVAPHTHLAMSLGCAHVWDERQLCWRPELGVDGATSLPGCRIAGDGGGIAGWRIAQLDGSIAGLAAAAELGKAIDVEQLRKLRSARAKQARLRPFLDAWYRPRPALLAPADDVVVCRCEEKTAGDVRAAVASGCLGSNQVKAFTRCGMGPCQGRACGLTLTTLIAALRGVTPQEAGALRIRPPLKPLTLGELASLPPDGG